MNFDSYKTFKKKKEEFTRILNEAWKSKNIMGMIDLADKNSDRAWYQSFVKDFYKHFNISIDKIKDSDFTEIEPDTFFNKKPYNLEQDRYLAIFINDDKKLEQKSKKDLIEYQKELKDAIKKGESKQKIEEIKAYIDLNKKLKVPFIVAIGMGRRVVYYDFRDELDLWFKSNPDELPPPKKKAKKGTGVGIQYGTPRKALRYGINPAMWLQQRYFGLDQGEKLTGANTAERSTKAYVVDVEELKTKYDMGTKLADRKDAKVNNPFFMTDDEIKALNMKRYKMMKDNDVNPESLLADLQKIVKAYNEYYMDAIQNVNDASFKSLKNQSFKFEGKEFKGLAEVFQAFTDILDEYFAVYKNYTTLMKETPEKIKKLRGDKKVSKQTYGAEEHAFITQHDAYILEMIDLKKKAERLASELESKGVKFQKKK